MLKSYYKKSHQFRCTSWVLWQHAVLCCEECPATDVHSVARTIWLPDDGPRTETCRSVLMCKFYKFYICAVVGIIIEYQGIMFILPSPNQHLMHHHSYTTSLCLTNTPTRFGDCWHHLQDCHLICPSMSC